MFDHVARLPHVRSVTSPFSAEGAGQVSKDGKVAFATVDFNEQSQDLPQAAVTRVMGTAPESGCMPICTWPSGARTSKTPRRRAASSSTGAGIVLALVVLVLAFGALFAAFLPLITALIAIGIGYSLTGLLSHVFSIASFATILGILIGLGVGVDYALFIVTRHRNAIKAGEHRRRVRRQCPKYGRTGGIFRRDHRLHRPARPVRPGPVLPLRRGGVRIVDGGPDHGGVADPAALPAWFCRDEGASAAASGHHCGQRPGRRGGDRALVPLGQDDRAPPLAPGPRRPAVMWSSIALPILSLTSASTTPAATRPVRTTLTAYNLLAKGFGPGFSGPLQLVAELPTPAHRRPSSPSLGPCHTNRRRGSPHPRCSARPGKSPSPTFTLRAPRSRYRRPRWWPGSATTSSLKPKPAPASPYWSGEPRPSRSTSPTCCRPSSSFS